MIRLFLNLCKYFQLTKSNNDHQICLSYADNANVDIIPCPHCSSMANYHGCGSYTRTLICYTSGHVERHEITVTRIECASCERSHALLAPVIIPYSPFSFHFIISLLYDFITHKFSTVAALCSEYDISVSTLYRIYHRFIEDRMLMLGMMEAASTQACKLIDMLASSDFFRIVDCLLHDFYKSNHTSFLQARCRIRLSRSTLNVTSTTSP